VRPVPEIPHFDWAVLKAPEASGETFCDGKGFIKGSSRTISHEACHVFVGLGKEAEEHGPKFFSVRGTIWRGQIVSMSRFRTTVPFRSAVGIRKVRTEEEKSWHPNFSKCRATRSGFPRLTATSECGSVSIAKTGHVRSRRRIGRVNGSKCFFASRA